MKCRLKNGLPFSIDEATENDASAVLRYLKTVGGESHYLSFGMEGVGIDERKEADTIARYRISPNSTMLLGKVGWKLASVATLTAMETSRFSHNAELGISVLKEFWGLGIGTLMCEELIRFAKGTGHLKVIHLSVIGENERALALYKKLGFIQTGCHKSFSKIENKFLDAVLMDYML